ncbi:MAG: hypothetical protein ACXVX6_05355 [Mycobacterium sp.]
MPPKGHQSLPPPHGTSARYNRGCRCGDCALARSDRARKARLAKAAPLGIIDPQAASAGESSPVSPGPAEQAVRAELETLPEATEQRLALAAIAVVLAQGLDNPAFRSSHPGMSRELAKVLDKLRTVGVRRLRLVDVSKLSRGGPARV